jgi:hypothetical protein
MKYLIITKNVPRVVVSNVSDEVVPVTIVQPGVNVMKLYFLRHWQNNLYYKSLTMVIYDGNDNIVVEPVI